MKMRKLFTLAVLFVLSCLLGNRALAQNYQKAGEISFAGLQTDYGLQIQDGYEWSDNTLLSAQGKSLVMQVDGTRTVSLRVDQKNVWNIGNSSEMGTSYFQQATQDGWKTVHIDGLKQGDKIKLTTNPTKECAIWSNNTNLTNSGQNQRHFFTTTQRYPSIEFIVTSDGSVDIQNVDQYSGIHKVELYVEKDSHFDYDPGYEEYDMYDEFTYRGNNNNSQNSNDTQFNTNNPAGFNLNGNAANYITFTKSKISANNRIAVDQSGTWRFNYGLRPPTNNTNTWSNFSICNLRVGDRVVVSYMGDPEDLVFSSAGNSSTYNGCAAFVDKWNDGVYHENVDKYIQGGMPVQTEWQRNEEGISGNYGIPQNNQSLQHQLYYTKTYVIAENGHLDFGIKNGPVNRLVKIKIYSDHQAMMVDDYIKENYRYTAHFNISGELQIKEHIMPGGLEIHIGNDNPDQHAIVVASQKDGNHNQPIDGYVSYVNAVDGYKIPGVEKSANETYYVPKFDLAPGNGINSNGNSVTYNASYDRLPTTGTYYVFKPEASGKMKFRFKANSINYYRWDLAGNAVYYGDNWDEIYDRPNEQTLDVKCPYYLVTIPKATENNPNPTPTFQKLKEVKNGEFYETPNEIEVQEGYTYYLYGAWNATDMYFKGCDNGAYIHNSSNGASGYNRNYQNNIEWRPIDSGHDQTRACGVAELLWVDFTPQRSIFPLAKWVPNNTKAVKEGAGKVNGVPNPDYPTDESKYEHELADVQGYVDAQITVKKMSGNIEECRPYIWRAHPNDQKGKLRIDGIKFKDGENPGGTILIKIGNPDDKSEPLYTLTIAYSAEYNKGNTEAGRGHKWDFSTNSLQGLTWGLNQTQITAGQTFTYPQADTNEVFHNSTNGGYAVERNLGNYFSNYFGETISNYSSAADVRNRMSKNTIYGSDGWPASLLFDEIDYQDEHGLSRSDWMFNFNLVNDGQFFDPIFVNKYDMEGDNADMVWNSEGLVFQTSSGQSGIFDEYGKSVTHSSSETTDPDRYIGIMEGGKFRIPWLKKDDRVIIYMGIGTLNLKEQAKFSIKNAFDAEHNIILPTDDYVVGGSHWDGEKGDPYYRGCYHFFAQGDGNGGPADMVFEMKEGPLCKIYSIQIYRGDRINTNEVVGVTLDEDGKPTGNHDNYLLWSTAVDPNDGTAAKMGPASNWSLNYFGKDQKLADGTNNVVNEIIAKTGNIDKTKISTIVANNTFTYPHALGEIGTFRVRGKDMEKNMKYVADYADHNITVAYQETQKYPYTWDFMDMTGYKGEAEDGSDGNNASLFEPEEQLGESTSNDEQGKEIPPTGSGVSKDVWNSIPATSYQKTARDLSLWEVHNTAGNYFLRLNSQVATNVSSYPTDKIFETAKRIDGNQVWANGQVIPETQGLWFYTEDNVQTTAKWTISDDGMSFYGTDHTLVVPNVPADAAVYLRMETIPKEATSCSYILKDKDGETDFVAGTNYLVYGPTQVDGTNEYILAFKNNSTKKHLILSLGGYELKKVAVSVDKKTLGRYGWATESRERVIDPSLTAYLSGKNIETIIATGTDYASRTVTLTRMNLKEKGDLMQLASADKSKYACILHNAVSEEPITILDGGFHLFIPDMHDYDVKTGKGLKTFTTANSSIMKAQLTSGTVTWSDDEGDTKNFVLTSYYQKVDKDDNVTVATSGAKEEGFYRVGKNNPITSNGHQGYLPISTSVAGGNAKFSIVFEDIVDDFQGIATSITEAAPLYENATWYNLNGQKLNGKPTEKGLYIMNGKKVMVK